jgi:hypothetical protein
MEINLNMSELKNEVLEKIKELNKKKKVLNLSKSVFIVGNTKVKYNSNYYWTPFRKSSDFISIGIILFSENEVMSVFEIIDGKVDFVYIDCEKKSVNRDNNKPFDIETLGHLLIKKSILRFYKGNDITTDAIDSLVRFLLRTKNKLVVGSNILIVGIGNLGFKTSLKLVERGANVFILNRTKHKANKLINVINIIKPIESISSVQYYNFYENKAEFDIVLLCHLGNTKKYNNIYYSQNSHCDFIDVGKGCLESSQINFLINKGHKCLRLDIGDSLIGFIETDISFFYKRNFILPNFKIIENSKIRILTRGLIGAKDDMVFDNIDNPTFFYGICDGKGGFKKTLSKKDLEMIKKILKDE